MADIVYLYPKTSCPSDTCLPSYPVPKDGIKSNLSVRGCGYSPYFDCYNTVELKREIQPCDKTGIYNLNPEVYTEKLAEGFDAVRCSKECPVAPCSDTIYISQDPRQFDAVRADYTRLDSIPIDGNVRLRDIYSKKYDDYGKGFNPYEKIRDGQILYYVDRSIENAFYKPVYSEQAEESSVLYKDPMGAMKPEYNRKALINTENPTVNRPASYPYCLSFMQDTQSYREDLIALQQRKHNQEKWSARWGSLDE